MEEVKKTWGGVRTGAGRKAKDGSVKVQLSCKVAPDVFEAIKERAEAKGVSLGKIVEDLCRCIQGDGE